MQVGVSTLPSLDVRTQAARQHTLNLTGVGPEALHYNMFIDQLQAHYILGLFGATRYANAAGAVRVDIRGCEPEATRHALAANIVGIIINAAALDQQITLAKHLVVMADAVAQNSQRRYELGALSHAQVLAST